MVQAISSDHINGHTSYSVNSPAGREVSGGDAVNNSLDFKNRPASTSGLVEALVQDASCSLSSSAVFAVVNPLPSLLFSSEAIATNNLTENRHCATFCMGTS